MTGAPRHGITLRMVTTVPPGRRRLDLEGVHQPLGADQPQPETGARAVLAAEDRRQLGDAGALVAHRNGQQLGGAPPLDRELHPAPARVADGVAGDLGDGGGDPRLGLDVEAEQLGDLPGPLARVDDVVLPADVDGEDVELHAGGHRATTTVASSRRRAKSR